MEDNSITASSHIMLTDDARYILEDAKRRAVARANTGAITPLLVLWSILRWERKVAQSIIHSIIEDPRELEQCVDISIPVGPMQPLLDFVHIDAIAKSAIQQAESLKHNYVGTEHLLLALCECNDSITRDILQRFGISRDKVQMRLLSSR